MTRLEPVVDPNDAGKSIFVDHILLLALRNQPFVNADEIAKFYWPETESKSGWSSHVSPDVLRAPFIAMGELFIAATAFLHSSKVHLIREALAGYRFTSMC